MSQKHKRENNKGKWERVQHKYTKSHARTRREEEELYVELEEDLEDEEHLEWRSKLKI